MAYLRSRLPLPADTPGTNFIIIANVVTFVLIFIGLFPAFAQQFLISTTLGAWHSPWTFFTYPLVAIPDGIPGLINLAFSCLWLYFLGGILERNWGTGRFLTIFFVFSAISVIFLAAGGLLLGIEAPLGGLYEPLVALTVLWAMLSPTTPVLFFIFPMQLRWLALLVCVLSYFSYGQINPIFGLFSLGGAAAAYLYMKIPARRGVSAYYQTSSGHGSNRTSFSWLNPFEWYRRWRFKQRFRKLWGK